MSYKMGKEWKWPSEEMLIDWERRIRVTKSQALTQASALMLIRFVRSQRRVIEKLAKLLVVQESQFTREDVESLEKIAFEIDELKWAEVELRELTARIAALLPPASPEP